LLVDDKPVVNYLSKILLVLNHSFPLANGDLWLANE